MKETLIKILGRVLLILVVFLLGCNIINPEEPIPSYIKITALDLTTDPNDNEGTDSHNITDAWIFFDDNLFGAFELPVEIAVLKEGNTNVKVFPGIKKNGQSTTRVRYPFYKPAVQDINLIAGETNTTFNHSTLEYFDNLFFWNDDFESPGIKFDNHPSSDTTIERTTEPTEVFEGNGAAVVYMDANHTYFQCVTDENFEFPTNGLDVYLELNFKTNNTVRIGIYAEYAGQSQKKTISFLNPTTEWKKIYVPLTEGITPETSGTKFELFFEVFQEEATNPIVFLDNVKLVHFQ